MVASNADQHFSGEITVAARIIDLLSSGLYESPAACLKELINNSYDADARNVEIFVKPDANRIIIQDDGEGMSREDAYAAVQRCAMRVWAGAGEFRDLLAADPAVSARLGGEELDACFDPRRALTHVGRILDRALAGT